MIELTLATQLLGALFLMIVFFYVKDFKKSPTVAYLLLTFALIFAYVNIASAQSMSLIYILFGFLASFLSFIDKPEPTKPKIPLMYSYGLGFLMLFFMFGLQTFASGLVIGVPLAIPSSVRNGVYTLEVRILDYSALEGEISTSFHVVSLESDKLQLYFIILILVVVFIGILVLYDLKINRQLREGLNN